MSDLIDRQAAIEAIRECQTYLHDDYLKIGRLSAEAAIMQLPPAPEKTGHCGTIGFVFSVRKDRYSILGVVRPCVLITDQFESEATQ